MFCTFATKFNSLEMPVEISIFNPFHATDLFQYPLKTSENQRFSDVFQGVLKETSGMKWVKKNSRCQLVSKTLAVSTDFEHTSPFRSSHRRCPMKKAVLKNFAIFTGKFLCWSLLNKVVLHESIFYFIKNLPKGHCDSSLLFLR